jgi:nitronate monooxygenase
MNLLTKVALPTIHSLYGAMLAGVDYVIMGAGIPIKIPGILDALADGEDCSLPIEVSGAPSDEESFSMDFSPKAFWKGTGSRHVAETTLKRPAFLPIVSSTTLAQSLLKRSNGKGPTKGVDGFVVELNTAGGHNAPPRGWHFEAGDSAEPTYGDKDMVDVKAFAKVAKGLPFWFAGSYGSRAKLDEILEGGGSGVQVSRARSLCRYYT